MPRLLFCKACHTLEEVPDYEGKQAVDPFVEALLLRHTKRDPLAHGNDRMRHSVFRLSNPVDPDAWANDREKVLKAANKENRDAGFDTQVYEAQNAADTFKDDAMRCFREHHRPPEGCSDYWSDSKRIGRPTEEGRAVIKEQYKLGRADPHLCAFCPVHTWVTTQVRFKRGDYKEN